VELDVYACPTGELVVIHDDKVDRTTDGTGYVFDKSFDELRKLDAGKGEKIPTLQEVLDLVDKKVTVNIELKGVGTAGPVADMVKDYMDNKGWDKEKFLISSFNHHELKQFKEILPEINIGALMLAIPVDYAKFAEDLGAYSVNPGMEFISQEFVDDAHKRGLKVFVWTVNDEDDIARMKALGVDGLFSNFVDKI